MLTDESRRRDFPSLTGRAYLNTAAEGIPPLAVGEALARYFRDKQLGMDGRTPHAAAMFREVLRWDPGNVQAAALLQELSFSLLIHAPGYFSELGATEGMIGLLYASGAVVSLLFRPLLGRILDLTHRRTVLLIAAVGNIAILLALAMTDTWNPVLWSLFLAQRTVQIALFTTMLTYGADSIPLERRTQGLAIFGDGLATGYGNPVTQSGRSGRFFEDGCLRSHTDPFQRPGSPHPADPSRREQRSRDAPTAAGYGKEDQLGGG